MIGFYTEEDRFIDRHSGRPVELERIAEMADDELPKGSLLRLMAKEYLKSKRNFEAHLESAGFEFG